MTDEEINRKFDTVAEHLVTLAIGQQKSDERIARLERVLLMAIRTGRRERSETSERINALVAAQIRTEEALTRMAEAQAHSDKRLDALIDIVSEGRNGKSNQ